MEIKIIYIDRLIDNGVSRCIGENFMNDNLNIPFLNINYTEKTLNFEHCKYNVIDDFLCSREIIDNDIIMFDSAIFEYRKNIIFFSGERIKEMLEDLYPEKEIIIISQEGTKEGYCDRVQKYDCIRRDSFQEIVEYYDKELTFKLYKLILKCVINKIFKIEKTSK